MVISKSKLKTHMLRIFREIEESGEELIITDHNKPVLVVRPYLKMQTVEEIFDGCDGKVIYNEDIASSTEDEWKIS